VAITLAGRRRTGSVALRDAVARVTGEADRVLRTPSGVSVVREYDGESDPREDAERLRQLVSSAVADDLSAGVAGPKQGASGAHFALLQAEHALAVGRGMHGHGRTIHFDELGAFRFILNQPVQDIRDFAERLLGPIATDGGRSYLFDTLESYMRNSGSVNAVARQMFLHRNTVRHRLRRIATITGADLDDPDTRLALWLAILGRRAIAHMELAS
jgi:PucR family transcriptional regulator, purine catabolism regulatory protein